MAIQEYWLGSRGPFLFDDADTYPDGTTFQGARFSQMRIDNEPTEDDQVAKKTTVDTQAEIDQRYSLMLS